MAEKTTEQKRIERGVCARCGKQPPKPGGQRCETCLEYLRGRSEAWRRNHGCKPKVEGGPGAPPKSQGARATMEPQCRVNGRMRSEHVFDEDGLCDCGQKRTTFAPRPALRDVTSPPVRKVRSIADLERPARPGKGGSHKPKPEERRAFGQMDGGGPKPSPATPTVIASPAIPDPVAATIAQLELEREELDQAIETLRRHQRAAQQIAP